MGKMFLYIFSAFAVLSANAENKVKSACNKMNSYEVNFLKKNKTIKLTNGIYKYKKGHEDYYKVILLPQRTYIEADRVNPVASYGGIVALQGKGSRTFYYLVLFKNGKSISHKFLGDRIKVKSIYFLDGQLQVDYYIHGPKQAMSEKPKVLKQTKIPASKIYAE